jgi:cell division protein ZapA (FtsZ GTPase activity inhibitor)
MKQEMKDSENSIIIGRGAKGANIKIDATEFNVLINKQFELLLKKETKFESIEQKINTKSAEIEKLRGEIDKLKAEKKLIEDKINNIETGIKKALPKWVYWVWSIAIVSSGFAITALFIGVTPYVCWNVETVSLSIILTFVGILATVIVVSNYSQVKEIRNEFEIRIKNIEGKFEKQTEKLDNAFNKVVKYWVDFPDDETEEKINNFFNKYNVLSIIKNEYKPGSLYYTVNVSNYEDSQISLFLIENSYSAARYDSQGITVLKK